MKRDSRAMFVWGYKLNLGSPQPWDGDGFGEWLRSTYSYNNPYSHEWKTNLTKYLDYTAMWEEENNYVLINYGGKYNSCYIISLATLIYSSQLNEANYFDAENSGDETEFDKLRRFVESNAVAVTSGPYWWLTHTEGTHDKC